MRNWTFGNNEQLAVPTYISGVISCFALTNETIDLCLKWQIVLYYEHYESFFLEFTINHLSRTDCLNKGNWSYRA
jgi:hypothetical protein